MVSSSDNYNLPFYILVVTPKLDEQFNCNDWGLSVLLILQSSHGALKAVRIIQLSTTTVVFVINIFYREIRLHSSALKLIKGLNVYYIFNCCKHFFHNYVLFAQTKDNDM